MKKIIFSTIFIFLALIVTFIVSPRPTAYIIKQSFKQKIARSPSNYEEYINKVKIIKNQEYNSKYKENYYDIYVPKKLPENAKIPAIIWVHGGAFVGGDKSDIEIYATILAAKGYAVFTINYELAPSSKYPGPINQLSDFYKYFESINERYNVDSSKLFFAGDSAGAQIVGEFINKQTNTEYSISENTPQLVKKNNIKGVLLYCGPYNFEEIGQNSSFIQKFIFDQVGWAYFGEKLWRESKNAKTASVINNVSKDFPPVYITDGNTGSFEKQGTALVEKMKLLNIDVTFRFFPLKEVETKHEFQFLLDTEPGVKVLNDTIYFLEKYNK